jgi:hypothetical protein
MIGKGSEKLMILGAWELIGIVLPALVAGMFYGPCPIDTNVKDGEL